MDKLTIFNIVAGAASILALLLVLFSAVRKKYRQLRQKQEDAEATIQRWTELLERTGGTVSGRTDLGFFVLLELGGFRDMAAGLSHLQTRTVGFFVLSFSLAIYAKVGEVPGSSVLSILAAVAMLVCLLLTIVMLFVQVFIDRIVGQYENRIKEVWRRAVEKRMLKDAES